MFCKMVIRSMAIVALDTKPTKMSQAEVQQVEQKAGQPVENLSEEQLDATMGELGIEGQEPTDAEVAALEAEEDKNPSV
jgi:hypothetical protein